MPTIKELRKARGWSQEELAGRARVSAATVNRMERGHPVIKSSLFLVAHALGVAAEQVTGVSVISRGVRSSRESQK